MSNLDLIGLVRPAGGWYGFLAVKDKTKIRQLMFETRRELDEAIAKYVEDRWCVFFGLAKYKDGSSRAQDNVESLKSFWVDIDCGPNKSAVDARTGRPQGYETQVKGLNALKEFCKATKLPLPLIVNSGNGIHAYWPLEEDVPRDEWDVVAKRLRQACIDHEFYVDTKVFEAARVLRPLYSKNYKGDASGKAEKPVLLIREAAPISFNSIRSLFNVVEGAVPIKKPRRGLSALGQAILANSDTSFKRIMQRAAKKDGCAQLNSCYTERATLSEPRWFDALSVAKFCSDGNEAVHKLSSGHPDYNPLEVERKILHIAGPHSCAEFEINNAGGCEGCPHKGKITSPIVLGKVIARAAPKLESKEQQSEGRERGVHVIPALPDPYFRGKSGGVYAAFQVEDEELPPKLIYHNDLYIEKLMEDPFVGFVAVVKHHMPKDGVKEFILPNASVTDRRELSQALSKNGVITNEAGRKLIIEYLITSIKELQYKEKAEQMRLQYGWADNDTKFIVGDREITHENRTYYSPPSSVTKTMTHLFNPKGTLDAWKEAIALYSRPGLEIQAFGVLSGFGSPLLKFTGQKGAVINLVHSDSGAGKTTVLRAANSVFGDPEMLLGNPKDTDVGKTIKVGILNNIVNTIDEVTNIPAELLSDMLYAFSQGRGKDKAKSNANELRENNTTWRSITLTSANAAFNEKLMLIKNNPAGEMMRLLEFKVGYTDTNIISTQEGKDKLDHGLNNNYGLAGEVYMRYVIGNLQQVKELVLAIQKKLDMELNFTQRERNWSAVVAANLAGGRIASKLGLLPDWDLGKIYKVVTTDLSHMRTEATAPVSDASSTVGDFINRHQTNILVVEDGVDKRTQMPKFPVLEPKGPLLIRHEPDTKKVFISVKAFKDDCVRYQINYADTKKALEQKGILLDITNKRLAKGSKIMSPGIRCLVLDASHSDFIDMDYMQPDNDESGEDNVRN